MAIQDHFHHFHRPFYNPNRIVVVVKIVVVMEVVDALMVENVGGCVVMVENLNYSKVADEEIVVEVACQTLMVWAFY